MIPQKMQWKIKPWFIHTPQWIKKFGSWLDAGQQKHSPNGVRKGHKDGGPILTWRKNYAHAVTQQKVGNYSIMGKNGAQFSLKMAHKWQRREKRRIFIISG